MRLEAPPDPLEPLDSLCARALRSTLGQSLRAAAADWPDKPALLSEERCLSWAQLDQEVDALCHHLAGRGLGRGDTIGFLLNKRPEVVVGFLACARLGAIFAPINFKLHLDHIRDQVRTANIRALFSEAGRERLVEGLADLVDPARAVIHVRPGAAQPWTPTASPPPFPEAAASLDEVCYLNYTSGTTGRPKGARTTHRNIQENAVATIRGLGFRPDDVFLGMFSVFAHPHELFHRSLVLGGAFVILDTLSPRVVAEAVQRFRVTWMMAVPSFYEMMLDFVAPPGGAAPASHERCDTSSLRLLESGGAYVGAETMRRMEAEFGCSFLPVWGCTEATGVGLANGPGERLDGATGRPIPGYEFRVVDEQGRDLPDGQVGELLMRGPSVASLGYVNMPEETAAHFQDGWYHTRDLVVREPGGYLRFTGRLSEMLKIGGIRVYPLEIEEVLKQHPEVRDCVVVRAEERVRGEIARAVISTIPGSRLDLRGVQAWCRARLSVYKVPRVIEFWQEIPKLPNGKIDKRAVLERPVDPERDERSPA